VKALSFAFEEWGNAFRSAKEEICSLPSWFKNSPRRGKSIDTLGLRKIWSSLAYEFRVTRLKRFKGSGFNGSAFIFQPVEP
jgi:hypothetical protein